MHLIRVQLEQLVELPLLVRQSLGAAMSVVDHVRLIIDHGRHVEPVAVDVGQVLQDVDDEAGFAGLRAPVGRDVGPAGRGWVEDAAGGEVQVGQKGVVVAEGGDNLLAKRSSEMLLMR